MIYKSEGKTTYWVRGNRFFNDANLRNGKQRATDYCLSNFIDVNEIITFDSVLECDRYEYLLELQKQGKISDLKHHLSLPLLPSYTNYNGDEIPELRYNADFVYKENGKNIVEDVKGASLFQDSRFEAVKQIFDYIYREKAYIRIVVMRDKQWVEWKLGDRKKPQKLIKKQSAKIKEQKAQLHAIEVAENKKKREIARLNELRELAKTTKLKSDQRKRLAELEERYRV
jgi:hypothetical protein